MFSFSADSRYFEFVREERQFTTVLAHLLLQRGSNGHDNLAAFMRQVNPELKASKQVGYSVDFDRLVDPQVYVEFAFLRDHWDSIGRDNVAKRGLIFELFGRVENLKHLKAENFPTAIREFNAWFMGAPGLAVKNDIISPGRWSVKALCEQFGDQAQVSFGGPTVFSALCNLKWAFNIKPDIVIAFAGGPPLCIECKLESAEGYYPVGEEIQHFKRVFDSRVPFVRQVELQRFMFDRLLGNPCQSLVIAGKDLLIERVPTLIWKNVFANLDLTSSLQFGDQLVHEGLVARDPESDLMMVTFAHAIATCRDRGDAVEVRYDKGRAKLAILAIEEARESRWRMGAILPKGGARSPGTWIRGSEFTNLIGERGAIMSD